jgi:hypothetical protein
MSRSAEWGFNRSAYRSSGRPKRLLPLAIWSASYFTWRAVCSEMRDRWRDQGGCSRYPSIHGLRHERPASPVQLESCATPLRADRRFFRTNGAYVRPPKLGAMFPMSPGEGICELAGIVTGLARNLPSPRPSPRTAGRGRPSPSEFAVPVCAPLTIQMHCPHTAARRGSL